MLLFADGCTLLEYVDIHLHKGIHIQSQVLFKKDIGIFEETQRKPWGGDDIVAQGLFGCGNQVGHPFFFSLGNTYGVIVLGLKMKVIDF